MPRGNTPPPQRGRVIAFVTNYGLRFFPLSINPEDLTRHEPSRMAVQQTLGGAWADVFDKGVAVVKINGTTGWHGGPPDAPIPGEIQFHMLRDSAFEGWHAERDRLIQAGADPAGAQMVLVDPLNGFVDLVAPKNFTLRRSKSSPLMMRYSIELLVLQPLASVGSVANAVIGAALGALEGVIGEVGAALGNALDIL